MTKDLKQLIDSETSKEINRALKDVPYMQRSTAKKENESDFQKMKAQQLTEGFMTAEPLLIEQIEEFREELNAAIQGEVDKLVEENFTHIDRV